MPGFMDQAKLAQAEGRIADAASWLRLVREWTPPLFPLTGNDLRGRGIPEGKQLGETLKQLEEYWEDKDYRPDKKALLSLALPKK
jgi:poly(A) polymerase